jgi:hypothetical protein
LLVIITVAGGLLNASEDVEVKNENHGGAIPMLTVLKLTNHNAMVTRKALFTG